MKGEARFPGEFCCLQTHTFRTGGLGDSDTFPQGLPPPSFHTFPSGGSFSGRLPQPPGLPTIQWLAHTFSRYASSILLCSIPFHDRGAFARAKQLGRWSVGWGVSRPCLLAASPRGPRHPHQRLLKPRWTLKGEFPQTFLLGLFLVAVPTTLHLGLEASPAHLSLLPIMLWFTACSRTDPPMVPGSQQREADAFILLREVWERHRGMPECSPPSGLLAGLAHFLSC